MGDLVSAEQFCFGLVWLTCNLGCGCDEPSMMSVSRLNVPYLVFL